MLVLLSQNAQSYPLAAVLVVRYIELAWNSLHFIPSRSKVGFHSLHF